MRCLKCSNYIPSGLNLETCPACRASIADLEDKVQTTLSKQDQPLKMRTDVDSKEAPPAVVVSVRKILLWFRLIFVASAIFLIWRLVVNAGYHIRFDEIFSGLGIPPQYLKPIQFQWVETLFPVFFWTLTIGVVVLAGILRHEKEIQKKTGFITVAHVCLSPLVYCFGQLIMPIFLMVRAGMSLKIRRFVLRSSPLRLDTFISAGLIALVLIACADFFHSFIIHSTPSRGLLVFEQTTGLSRLVSYPTYSVKLFVGILISAGLSFCFMKTRRFILSAISILFFVLILFTDFRGASIYRGTAESKLTGGIEKMDTADLLRQYGSFHPLAKEIALEILKSSRVLDVRALLQSEAPIDQRMVWAALIVLRDAKQTDMIPSLLLPLKDAVATNNVSALIAGVEFLAEVNSRVALDVLNEVEAYASSDDKYIRALKVIRQVKRIHLRAPEKEKAG